MIPLLGGVVAWVLLMSALWYVSGLDPRNARICRCLDKTHRHP